MTPQQRGARRIVPVRLWQVGVAFAAVVAVFVVGQVQLSCQAARTRSIAAQAKTLAEQNRALVVQNTARIKENYKTLVVQCRQRDDLRHQYALTQTFLYPKTDKQRAQARQLFSSIPRDLVLGEQKRAKDTLDNLAILTCSRVKLHPHKGQPGPNP